jgi:hypothetical protein
VLPPRFDSLLLRDVPLGDSRIHIEVKDATARVNGLPDRVAVIDEPCACDN